MRRCRSSLKMVGEGNVILQHSSLDMEGNAVGVFRVLGNLTE